ncbi:MAG: hypothetical protein OXT07_09190 [bacterium]|nr:hypothetical protein [bacterium]MDE0216532.1 hypothetical protein [bacterium]
MIYQNPPPHAPDDTASSRAGEAEPMASPKLKPSDYVLIVAALLLLMLPLGFLPVVVWFPAALAIAVLGARKWWFSERKVGADR